MCGIIGYIGGQQAAPILLDGLKRLEYRGYDSAGVAVMGETSDQPPMTKSEAKVDALIAKVTASMPRGKLGIGHTRWATHGRPTEVNAHPHIDCSGRIFAVHNGIIENFAELRTELAGQGHEFISDTDSEVIPHLVESLPHESVEELVLAVRLALGRLEGTYALALCSLDHPGLLIGARRNAPLVVGLAEGEWFLASDITAVIGHTKRVMPLGEGQMVVIDSNGPTITSIADGTILTANEIEVDWDVSQAEKAGFPHFMLKEIGEAPEAVANALRGRLDRSGSVQLDDILEEGGVIDRIDQVLLLGMGTSLHAAMVGEHVIEAWAGIPARAQDASEFRYRRPLVGPRTLVVVITQSGETADTLMAMRLAKECGSMTIAVTNVVGSTVAREADGTIFLHSGPEIGVASTKTFLAHLISQFLLALRLAELRNGIPVRQRREIATALLGLPEQLATVLAIEGRIAALARQYAGYPDFMYIGRGLGYPIALEGALKLKEISYLHAEGISAGDLKHGPIALLDSAFPVVALCTESAVAAKMVSNVHEIVARDAPVLALVSTGDPALLGIATDLLEMPPLDEVSMAILNSVALQLFAYHVAAALGLPIDQPRNLAKSVTVE